jgi:hypothetical protein
MLESLSNPMRWLEPAATMIAAQEEAVWVVSMTRES